MCYRLTLRTVKTNITYKRFRPIHLIFVRTTIVQSSLKIRIIFPPSVYLALVDDQRAGKRVDVSAPATMDDVADEDRRVRWRHLGLSATRTTNGTTRRALATGRSSRRAELDVAFWLKLHRFCYFGSIIADFKIKFSLLRIESDSFRMILIIGKY